MLGPLVKCIAHITRILYAAIPVDDAGKNDRTVNKCAELRLVIQRLQPDSCIKEDIYTALRGRK